MYTCTLNVIGLLDYGAALCTIMISVLGCKSVNACIVFVVSSILKRIARHCWAMLPLGGAPRARPLALREAWQAWTVTMAIKFTTVRSVRG